MQSDEFLNRTIEFLFTQLFHAPQFTLKRPPQSHRLPSLQLSPGSRHHHPPLVTLRLNSPVGLLLRHRNRLRHRRHCCATARRRGLGNRRDSFHEFFLCGTRLFLLRCYDEARLAVVEDFVVVVGADTNVVVVVVIFFVFVIGECEEEEDNGV